MSPNVYIIAGLNAAGKTTFAQQFLPTYAHCTNFVNADLIAQGVSPFSPEAAAFQAGRLMLDEIALCAQRRDDFGFETTLSGLSHLKLIRGLKNLGYQAHIFYRWLQRVDLALDRVRGRVLRGGHNLPEAVVRRRYACSIINFLSYYRPLAESWTLFDNSDKTLERVASGTQGKTSIIAGDKYKDLVARYGGK